MDLSKPIPKPNAPWPASEVQEKKRRIPAILGDQPEQNGRRLIEYETLLKKLGSPLLAAEHAIYEMVEVDRRLARIPVEGFIGVNGPHPGQSLGETYLEYLLEDTPALWEDRTATVASDSQLPADATAKLAGHADTKTDKKKNLQNIPFPSYSGYREFYNRVIEAELKSESISQAAIAKEIAAKHHVKANSLTRIHRRYMKASRESGR